MGRAVHTAYEPLESRLLLSTYYIAANGSDSAAGNITAPFASLKQFFSVAKPGDTVYLRGGTYNAAANAWRNTEPNVSGTAAAPITISNMPGETVILDHQDPTYDNFIQLYNGESYLNFQGLTVKNYLVDFNMQGGVPNHITLSNLDLGFCDLYGSNPDGRAVRMRGADNITISNVTVHDIGGVGIAGIGHNTNITMDGLLIHHINDGRPGDTDADGINFTYGDQSWSDNIIVRNTHVWDCTSDGIDIKADHVLEQNNVVWDIGSVGYKIWSVWDLSAGVAQQSHFTLQNCIGWNTGTGTVKCFSLPVVSIAHCIFIGETAGTESAFSYKRPYNTEPWQGSLSITNTVMEHLGGSPALSADKYSDTLFTLQGNTYYSTGSITTDIYTSSSNDQTFNGAAMTNGTFTSAMGTESAGQNRLVTVGPQIAYVQVAGPAVAGQPVSFTALAVSPQGDSVNINYNWTFGDGGTASGAAVTHAYSANGTYTVQLTATDPGGAAASSTINVGVGSGRTTNHPPVAPDVSRTTRPGTAVSGTLTATDADGDPITFTLATNPAHGTVTLAANGAYTYRPTAGYVGADSFTFTASDNYGGSDTSTFSIQMVNSVPATGDVWLMGNEDSPASSTVTATDADGDPVTFALASQPVHGTVAFNANGSFTFTPTPLWYGNDSFTFTASDPYSTSAPATVHLVYYAINHPPVAQNQALSTNFNTAITGAVTATDLDGDPLTYSIATAAGHGSVSLNANGSFTYTPAAGFSGADHFVFSAADASSSSTGTVTLTVRPNATPAAQAGTFTTNEDQPLPGQLSATDGDGDSLTYALGRAAAHGTVSMAANGSFTYTPAALWHGTDSFTFTAGDGLISSAAAVVNITVNAVNYPPTAQDLTIAGNEDTTITRAVTGSDINGDPLTFLVTAQPANGTLAFQPSGAFTYTPNATWFGQDAFSFVASDGSLQSAVHTVSIIINPVNHPPVAQNLSLQSDSQGVIGAVSATDVDGNALTYAKVTSPAHGTLTFNGDGSFVYMPATGYAGADSFTFVANDGTVNSAPATVSIQVVAPNPAPVAYDLALVSTNHSAAGNVLGSDSNGAPLTFRVLTQPGHGTVAFSADGSFLYTGNPAWALADSFTFCANDGQTDSAAATVTINPGTDQPPTAAAASFQTNQDVPVAGALTGTDPNGSSLSFSLVLMPSHGAASLGADGSFVYTPNSRWYGLDSFTFRVNDGTADSQPATVGIRVARVNHKPGKIDRTIRASATQPTVSSTLVATSIDNTPLTYSAVSQPDYGTVQVQPDGSFTYTPNAPGVLTDSFTYVASNGVLTSDVATVTIQLGNRLGFDGHSKVSFVDANGGTVTVSLIGPGGGYILFDQAGNCDPSSIVLNGTTAKSSVIVSLRGQMNVGEIDINGALGAFTAAAANLTGDLTASGTIGKLTLADVSGSQMTIGAGDATASSTITLNNVVDSSLTSGTAIKSLSVIGWSGTGNTTETLTAPALVSLTTRGGKNVSGDWDANLTLTGQQQPQPILGTVRIAGDVDGSIWDVAGTVGSVLVSGNVTQWSLDASTITSMMVSGNAQSLTMDLGTADLRLLRLGNSLGVGITAGHVGTIIATQWVGGFLHGDTLTAMNITQNLDADLSIANSQSAAAPVGAITVGGDITGGQWNLVGSARSVSAGNIDNLNLTAGRLGTMTARGDLAGSRLVFTQGVGPAAALSRLTVNGNLSGSTILSAGNIGAVTAGTLTNSAILLGLRPDYATDANGDGVLDLPTAGDFVSNAQLSSLTVRGGQGASSFTNSNVAAGQIGRVSLRDVNLANAQQAFGFTANQSINSIQWTQGRSRYTWEQNVWPADTGDLVVQIV